jgi:signal transduction histidine kinase
MVLVSAVMSLVMLREVNRRQRQFNADVAHELRTPLTALRGTIEAMLDGVWLPTTERLRSCTEEIGRLTKLVEDLSLLTDIEWEYVTLRKTDFDLADLLRATSEPFRAAARQKGLALVLDTQSQVVRGDYDRLGQVFANLLSNAIKYTDTGTVTVGNTGREVTVGDTGMGIPAEALPQVFDRFFRTDASRARRTGGAGIGLAIAAALVKAHGGSISAESEVEKGSVFRVRL